MHVFQTDVFKCMFLKHMYLNACFLLKFVPKLQELNLIASTKLKSVNFFKVRGAMVVLKCLSKSIL